MKKDSYFKAAFFTTIIVMIVVFSSNVERAVIQPPAVKEEPGKRIYEKIDTSRIEELIGQDRLSDKEAMYYRIIEED